MKFTELPLAGVYKIELQKHNDNRGFFARSWCKNEFEQHRLCSNIVQINNSLSTEKGTLRGLHFQYPPRAETKIVRCLKGVIWDVVVDIRLDSQTYGKWYGMELSEENRIMMYVPEGFAHGFITLSDFSEIIYFVSEFYSPNHEGTLRWDDSFHKIKWPIVPQVISDKDASMEDWTDSNSIKTKLT